MEGDDWWPGGLEAIGCTIKLHGVEYSDGS